MKGHNHHLHRLHKNQFVSMGDINLQQLDYLESRKKSSSFITQKTIGYDQTIYLRHQELNYYLDHLGDKIQGVIHHNQAEILTAYKRHFAKVKKQLDDFKKKTQAQANSSSSYKQKIELLQKQLIVFRQESLKLFSNVVQKDKTIEQLKLHLDQLLSEKKHMDALVKQLTKKNRDLEFEKTKKQPEAQGMNLQINSFTHNFEVKNTVRQKRYLQTKRPFSNLSKRAPNTLNQSKTINYDQQPLQISQPQSLRSQLKTKFSSLPQTTIMQLNDFIHQLLTNSQRKWVNEIRVPLSRNEKDNKYTHRSKSNYTVDIISTGKNTIDIRPTDRQKDAMFKKSQQFSQNLESGEYFKKCIQIIRKEIGVRKKINSMNFFKSGTPISIQEFKRIDFMRLMELLCGHQQVIKLLYNSLMVGQK